MFKAEPNGQRALPQAPTPSTHPKHTHPPNHTHPSSRGVSGHSPLGEQQTIHSRSTVAAIFVDFRFQIFQGSAFAF